MLVSAFWGIASGIVGAVVVLMGVIAFRLNAECRLRRQARFGSHYRRRDAGHPYPTLGDDYRLCRGVRAVDRESSMPPPCCRASFSPSSISCTSSAGRSSIRKIAPKLSADQYRVTVPDWIKQLESKRSRSIVPQLIAAAFRPSLVRGATTPDGQPVGYGLVLNNVLLALLVPVALTVGTYGATWWYVVIYNAPAAQITSVAAPLAGARRAHSGRYGAAGRGDRAHRGKATGTPERRNLRSEDWRTPRAADAPPEEMTTLGESTTQSIAGKVPAHFYKWFWGWRRSPRSCLPSISGAWTANSSEILKELSASVVPLGVLTFVVLAVILFGICTATESAAIGALGAMYLAP